MENKLVISCRMMHNLIKIYHVVQELLAFSLIDQGGTDEWMDGLTQRLLYTPAGRAILFRL